MRRLLAVGEPAKEDCLECRGVCGEEVIAIDGMILNGEKVGWSVRCLVATVIRERGYGCDACGEMCTPA